MHIPLPGGSTADVLYQDRAALALDKPAGWVLAPDHWERTGRNLQSVLATGVRNGDGWARLLHLRFIRFVHRLDAETTGVVLFGKSPGAIKAFSALFRERAIQKVYLAVVRGWPKETEWSCYLRVAPDQQLPGRMRVSREGQTAETHFRVLRRGPGRALIQARPVTGRTHQIRVHLSAVGHPILGDALYGPLRRTGEQEEGALALRATLLAYRDPFQRRQVRIRAPSGQFLRGHGFGGDAIEELEVDEMD